MPSFQEKPKPRSLKAPGLGFVRRYFLWWINVAAGLVYVESEHPVRVFVNDPYTGSIGGDTLGVGSGFHAK